MSTRTRTYIRAFTFMFAAQLLALFAMIDHSVQETPALRMLLMILVIGNSVLVASAFAGQREQPQAAQNDNGKKT